VYMLYNLFYE